ncbi:MAG: hypothetical protein AB7F59_15285 [Bdellovibrionales bacterium]
MTTKTFFLIAVALTTGLLTALFLNQPSTEDSNLCSEQMEILRSKFEGLSKVDIQEYLELKEAKARYEKADEILGKIMTIFLADLGIRVAQGQLKLLKEQASSVTKSNSPELTEKGTVLAQAVNTQITQSNSQQAPSAAGESQLRVNTNDVHSENELKDFFKTAQLESPTNAWRIGKGLNSEGAQMVSGIFEGEIIFDQPLPKGVRNNYRKEPWKVRFETQIKNANDTYLGEIRHYIWNEKGKRISRTTSGPNSELKNFRMGSDGSILIDAFGGDMIIQLYYFSNLSELSGIVYEKGTEVGSDFLRVGILRLQKSR